MVACDSTMMI